MLLLLTALCVSNWRVIYFGLLVRGALKKKHVTHLAQGKFIVHSKSGRDGDDILNSGPLTEKSSLIGSWKPLQPVWVNFFFMTHVPEGWRRLRPLDGRFLYSRCASDVSRRCPLLDSRSHGTHGQGTKKARDTRD